MKGTSLKYLTHEGFRNVWVIGIGNRAYGMSYNYGRGHNDIF